MSEVCANEMAAKQEDVERLLRENEAIDSERAALRSENERLWKLTEELRQRIVKEEPETHACCSDTLIQIERSRIDALAARVAELERQRRETDQNGTWILGRIREVERAVGLEEKAGPPKRIDALAARVARLEEEHAKVLGLD